MTETEQARESIASRLLGGDKQGRSSDDFYATDPATVRALLEVEDFSGASILEPCCGTGNISEVLKQETSCEVVSYELVDRGYGTVNVDFLKHDFGSARFTHVITNPPYRDAQEFIDKSLALTTGKVAMLLNIRFLEGMKRQSWFRQTPLKYVYVFSKRQDTWRGGLPLNPETGKRWGTTMCLCWYVWEHDFDGEPVIRWL